MKKRVLLFLCLFTLIILTGCIKEIKIPIGKVPSERFTVAEYIGNHAVYQAGSKLTIKGISEPGVIIVARLYDSKNNVESLVYSDTDNNGNWSISLDTPDPSFEEYSLKISDSNDRFHEYYNNIRFGESWMIVGDEIVNKNLDDEDNEQAYENVQNDYNNMFYYNGNWIPANSKVSEFGMELVSEISSSFKSWSKYPISVVFATDKDTNIYEWLSRDVIDSRNIIKTVLTDRGLYVDKDVELSESSMSNCYENHIKSIEGMSFCNVIVNQGIKDLMDSNSNIFYNDDYYELYYYMLYNFVDEIESKIVIEEKILLLQAYADVIENLEKLRDAQAKVSKFYNICEIIPTYDLTLVYDLVNEEYVSNKMDFNSIEDFRIDGIDFEKLAKRVCNVSNGITKIPELINVVQVYNDKKEAVEIKLVFENVESFVDEFVINGLCFYDSENNLIEDVEYKIEENEIIINLETTILVPADKEDSGESENINADDNLPELEDGVEMIEKIVYLDIVKISYAYINFNYFCNLKTNDIVVVPFEIILNE